MAQVYSASVPYTHGPLERRSARSDGLNSDDIMSLDLTRRPLTVILK
jgi:hypothetical protein